MTSPKNADQPERDPEANAPGTDPKAEAGDDPRAAEVQWREAEAAIEAAKPLAGNTGADEDENDGENKDEGENAAAPPADNGRKLSDDAPTEHESLPVVAGGATARLPRPPSARTYWSAEDAGRFMTAAIRTAQQPLEDALARRQARRWWAVLVLVGILVPAGFAAVGWRQYREAAEKRLADAVRERDTARAEEKRRVEDALAAHRAADRLGVERDVAVRKAEDTQRRLDAAAVRVDELQRELRESERGLAGARENAATAAKERDELRQSAEDATRWRRERELLRAQIDGMTQEQEALRRQLAATRALLAGEAAAPAAPATDDKADAAATTAKPESGNKDATGAEAEKPAGGDAPKS